jgi:hypothetical protein
VIQNGECGPLYLIGKGINVTTKLFKDPRLEVAFESLKNKKKKWQNL